MEAKKRKSVEEGEGAISKLPEDLLCHILSFLPTKDAALTSVLSKRWRGLFTLIPNLDLDDSIFVSGDRSKECKRTSFMEFVNRVFALQSNSPMTKFSLRCHKGVDEDLVEDWVVKALRRGATDLSLVLLFPSSGYTLPSSIFFYSQNLIKLKIGSGILGIVQSAKTRGNFSFTKLTTLHLDSVDLGPDDPGLALLLSKCPVLEELIVNCANWQYWNPSSLSAPTLKRLTVDCAHDLSNLKKAAQTDNENYIPYEYPPVDCSLTYYFGTRAPYTVSFDAPNLLYLNYSDFVAGNYPLVKLDSLVEARLDVGLNGPHVRAIDKGREIRRDATNLMMGMHNVQTLHISSDTLEVISDFCETVPVFHNLNYLSIESDDERGWQALPLLLINCPNLQTLVFHGLHHGLTDGCGDACDCIPPSSSSSSSSCLTSCPVKVLKILDFGATCGEMSLVEHFLKKLPRLEQVVIVLHSDSSQGEDISIFEVFEALEMAPRASSHCKLEVVNY